MESLSYRRMAHLQWEPHMVTEGIREHPLSQVLWECASQSRSLPWVFISTLCQWGDLTYKWVLSFLFLGKAIGLWGVFSFFFNSSRSRSSPELLIWDSHIPLTHLFSCNTPSNGKHKGSESSSYPSGAPYGQKQVHKVVIITRQGEAVLEACLWEYRNGSRYAKQFGSSGDSPQKGSCAHT